MRNVDGAWELVGLTSWGFACASSKTYGVYTRVSKFGEWLSNPPPIPPFSISPPEVRGLPMVGERLRCTPPAWNGDPRTGQIIEWIDDATGEVIFSGRTDIKLRRLDTGRSIRCDVTAKNGGGVTVARSTVIGPIFPKSPALKLSVRRRGFRAFEMCRGSACHILVSSPEVIVAGKGLTKGLLNKCAASPSRCIARGNGWAKLRLRGPFAGELVLPRNVAQGPFYLNLTVQRGKKLETVVIQGG